MSPETAKTNAGSSTVAREVVVMNRYGIHARPAALLVKAASRFTSEIMIEKDGLKVNAKSIMGLLTLEGNHGAKMRISATGLDAGAALEALAELFEKKFFED